MAMIQGTVAVVGLGYVGLPLAVEFGKRRRTIGFDISQTRIDSYRRGEDPTGELGGDEIGQATQLSFSADPASLAEAEFLIVAVPTPVDEAHRPDFMPLVLASETIGKQMSVGCTVIYESTVYPGATEEICIPVLEKHSGLRWKEGFFVGYSPERINPGDKTHSLTNVIKVVSGDTPNTAQRVDALYREVVVAGTHLASSIKVAEAAKVIENSQRDLNIAFMNELAIIFDMIGIDSTEVLEAAGTKWNFLPFRPGLVGGHCIGVDPYYLTHKAEMLGYHPEVILAGRRINDNMGKFIAEKTIKQMIKAGSSIKGAKVNVLGLTFKENCKDLRNSQVPAIIHELQSYGVAVSIHDPWADPEEANEEYGLTLHPRVALRPADAVVVAVAHREFLTDQTAWLDLTVGREGVVIDVKSIIKNAADRSLWRL